MATALSGVRDLCRVAARKARKTSLSSEKLFVSIAGEDSEVFGTVTDEVYRMRDLLKQSKRWHCTLPSAQPLP